MFDRWTLPQTSGKTTSDHDGDDLDMRLPARVVQSTGSTTTSSSTSTSATSATPVSAIGADGGPSAAALAEVSYLTGIATDGTVTSTSFWGDNGETAHKWGSSIAGTAGGVVTYYFSPSSNFTATEENTFRESFALWSAVANIQFVQSSSPNANVMIQRGSDGNAYESDGGLTSGSGSTIGSHVGQSLISIDTSVPGFDLSGSFNVVGGYGLQTAFHEIGHLLGLGHGGDYNGNVNPATQQEDAFDSRDWSAMSYINWSDTNAKYDSSYPVQANWGSTSDGYVRQSSSTIMPLDILAAQQLYGAPTSTPLSGGQVFGFHTNITGLLQPFFDFTIDTQPVVTLFDTGTGNTLDLSGFTQAAQISLTPGTFSSAGGLVDNIAIAFGTSITTAIGGSGNDTIVGTTGNDILTGGLGADTLTGNGGADTFRDTAADMKGDTITDFSTSDTINITNGSASGFTYSFANHVLSYSLGASSTTYSFTIADLASATFAETTDASGGIDLRLTTAPPAPTPPTVPTPPATTITALTATPDVTGTTLGTGDFITFTLDTSANVTVTGHPSLTLTNKLSATYVSGSGTEALTFRYSVASGDSSTDIKVSGLNTSAGTILDGSGNAPTGAVSIDTGIAVNAVPAGTTVFNVKSNTGDVYSLFETILGRAPSSAELGTYVAMLNAKTKLTTVAQDLLSSAEYTADYGAYSKSTSSAFVTQLFKDGVHHAPSSTNLRTDEVAIARGTSRAQVAVNVATSSEALQDLTGVFKAGVFVPGQSNASPASSSHDLVASISQAAASPAHTSGSNAEFIQALFEGAFGHDLAAFNETSFTKMLDPASHTVLAGNSAEIAPNLTLAHLG